MLFTTASQLHINYPCTFRTFENGFHVIHLSNRLWADITADIVIETKPLSKPSSQNNLLRKLLWTNCGAWPHTMRTMTAVQQVTNLSYTTTKHHKDSPETMMKRGASELEKITFKPVVCSPFSPDSSCREGPCYWFCDR